MAVTHHLIHKILVTAADVALTNRPVTEIFTRICRLLQSDLDGIFLGLIQRPSPASISWLVYCGDPIRLRLVCLVKIVSKPDSAQPLDANLRFPGKVKIRFPAGWEEKDAINFAAGWVHRYT